jgi:hypothetical protein
MSQGFRFEYKKWWHYTWYTIKDEWWMILVSVIIGLFVGRVFIIKNKVQQVQKIIGMGQNIQNQGFELGIDFFFPSFLTAILFYIFFSSNKFSDKQFLTTYYNLPLSRLEKLLSEFFISCLLVPFFLIIAYLIVPQIGDNSSLFNPLFSQPSFSVDIFRDYLIVLGMCVPIVSIVRIFKAKYIIFIFTFIFFGILWYKLKNHPTLILYNLLSFSKTNSHLETPPSNLEFIIPILLIVSGLTMYWYLLKEREMK